MCLKYWVLLINAIVILFHFIQGHRSQHRDEEIVKIVACLAALPECYKKDQDARVGDSLDEERSFMVFPLRVSQA